MWKVDKSVDKEKEEGKPKEIKSNDKEHVGHQTTCAISGSGGWWWKLEWCWNVTPKNAANNNNNIIINNAIKFKQLPELKSNFVVSSGTLIITHKAFAAAPVHASTSSSCSNSGGCGGDDGPIVPGEKCNATAKPMTVEEEKERRGKHATLGEGHVERNR